MKSTLSVISILLLLTLKGIESTYYAYTYDNGVDDDENCCFLRDGDDFCLARPLTQSLLQANKECQRLDANENNKHYLNRIVRRLNIEATHKVEDKILVELKTPLDDNILKTDLLCLSPSNNNNLNLEECVIELAPTKNKNKKKKKSQNANATVDQVVVEEITEEDVGAGLVDVEEPLEIREGHGLAFHESYDLNLTMFRPSSRLYRECWSWFRTRTKAICNNPGKFGKTCISLNHEREKCLQELFYKKINDNEYEPYSPNPLTVGSKLFCENAKKENKLLGYYRRSEICFMSHSQIHIRHKFTDFVSLSDKKKNRPVLEFILNSEKLTNEFETDCDDKTTLDELKKLLEQKQEQPEQPILNDNNPSEENE